MNEFICMHARTLVFMHAGMYPCMCTCMCMCIYGYMCLYVCM